VVVMVEERERYVTPEPVGTCPPVTASVSVPVKTVVPVISVTCENAGLAVSTASQIERCSMWMRFAPETNRIITRCKMENGSGNENNSGTAER